VELYFHPDYQKKFISELISSLSKNKFKKIKNINILFSTHSPFILSDIPSQNILKLINGDPQPFVENEQTFGANIHDLLANDFFLKKGFMGEYAKLWIEDLITYLRFNLNESKNQVNIAPKRVWDSTKAKQIISLVGEPILKMKLAEMYDEKFKDKFEIELLQKRIKEIEEGKF
jgi:hypothetical protein